MITTSTSTSSATYVIRVQYPGIQGAPGKLTFRLQFGPPVGPAPGRRAIS
jgi:hypothetical protein